MKPKQLFTILLLMACLLTQATNNNTVPATTNVTNSPVVSQQKTIQDLQVENQTLRLEIENLKKEMDLYRDDVRSEVSNINDKAAQLHGEMGRWATLLSIIIGAIVTIVAGGFGVIVPYFLNKKREEELDQKIKTATEQAVKATEQANIATTQANSAIEANNKLEVKIAEANNNLKDQIAAIQDKVEQAENSAKEAKISELFAQAVNEKDPSEAINLYNQILDLDDNEDSAYNNRGFLKALLFDKEGALKDFDKAGELNPESGVRYNNYAYLLYNHFNDFDNALQMMNKAISLNGKNYIFYNGRGRIYMAMKEHQKAINDFSQAIKLNDKEKDSYKLRALCYRKLAESEQDETKKQELIKKAESDEEIAKNL